MKYLLSIIISALTLSTVTHANQIEVSNVQQLAHYPSASASVFYNSTLVIAGDDAPNIVSINKQMVITGTIDIYHGELDAQERIAGELKHDLEAAEQFSVMGSPYLVFLGSGTYTDTREKALVYSMLTQHVSWVSIKPFYRSLRKVANLSESEFINIEGLASNQSTVFLLSRGSHGPNLIFSIPKRAFTDYIWGTSNVIPDASVQRVTLPAISDVSATLSGATWHEASQQLIITASVVDSDDTILGSYITSIDANKLISEKPIDLSRHACLISHHEQKLASKVESVAITQDADADAGYTGTLTADNDDGTSQIMTFEFNLIDQCLQQHTE